MCERRPVAPTVAVVLDVVLRVGVMFVAIDIVRRFAGQDVAPNGDGGPADLIALVAASWAVWNAVVVVVRIRDWTTKRLLDTRMFVWLAALSAMRWVPLAPLTDDYWGQDDRLVRLLAVGSIVCAMFAVVAIVTLERLARSRVDA